MNLWCGRQAPATLIDTGQSQLYFFPSGRRRPLENELADLGPGASIRIATSHFNDRGILGLLTRLSSNNVKVSVIAHDTTRRVPRFVEAALGSHRRISFYRYQHPQGFPMHNKFILVEESGTRRTLFGSLNLSQRSLRGNREVLLVTRQSDVFARFDECWWAMFQECQEFSSQL